MTNFALIENNTVTNIAVVPQEQAHRRADYMAKDLGLGGTWIEAGDASILACTKTQACPRLARSDRLSRIPSQTTRDV